MTVLAACGGSADSGGGSGTTSAAVVDDAKAAVAKNREGTDRALPSSAPKPEAGKNIWVISCTEAAEGCSAPAAGAKEAADLIGWDLTVFDGKARPDIYANGIRSAIADNADGIILDVVDCVAAKSAIEEAKKAGIKIFAFYAFDCNDPLLKDPGEPLFDAELRYGGDMTYPEYVEKVQSRQAADYIVAQTEGKAKVIMFDDQDLLVGMHVNKGITDGLKDCAGCEIVKQVPFNIDDLLTGKLGGKGEAALTQAPQANVLVAPYDSSLTGGIAQSVVTSGRVDDILVTGNEGLSPNIDLIRDNKGQDYSTGNPARWVGWAAVDSMNRLLQGEPQVDQGIGHQTIDGKGPFPKETTFYDGNINTDGTPKQDYVANFKKIWDVS
ncbi:sugar ABC transporter substrate-binding protein [Aeromicrobium sp. CF3.5]|uniref:sugar ABC transporter substrate-binding protein n=1 Tax=Aeromicrobium sp. CF3.5 TaxID=3373078 RepID=UPI003EE49120